LFSLASHDIPKNLKFVVQLISDKFANEMFALVFQGADRSAYRHWMI
jgi:hypothetical protein